MTATTAYRYEPIKASELTSCDLMDEMLRIETLGTYEAARIEFFDPATGQSAPEGAEIVFFTEPGRAGIAHGADAVWTDANSVEDAITRYLTNDLLP